MFYTFELLASSLNSLAKLTRLVKQTSNYLCHSVSDTPLTPESLSAQLQFGSGSIALPGHVHFCKQGSQGPLKIENVKSVSPARVNMENNTLRRSKYKTDAQNTCSSLPSSSSEDCCLSNFRPTLLSVSIYDT